MIITPGMQDNQPNFNSDREAAQWFEGKPTRREVLTETKRMSDVVQAAVNNEFAKVGNTLGQIVGMIRTQGLELEALVVSLDNAAPGFREGYLKEFRRQSEFVMFLEDFAKEGQHAEKPIKEKIDMVRAWNVREDVVKVYGDKFLLKKTIEAHHSEFTPEELVALESEFGVSFLTIPVTEVTNG